MPFGTSKSFVSLTPGAPYTRPTAGDSHNLHRAAHISHGFRKLRKLPAPCLVTELPLDHPARGDRIVPQMQKASQRLVEIVLPHLDAYMQKQQQQQQQTSNNCWLAPHTTCFALLGNDWILSPSSEGSTILQLCEVNSHPALGWGTMAKVPRYIYDDLVRDTLQIILSESNVLPSSFTPLTL